MWGVLGVGVEGGVLGVGVEGGVLGVGSVGCRGGGGIGCRGVGGSVTYVHSRISFCSLGSFVAHLSFSSVHSGRAICSIMATGSLKCEGMWYIIVASIDV